MDNLTQIPKIETYQILSRLAANGIHIHLKEEEAVQISKTTISKNAVRKRFYLDNKSLTFSKTQIVTFKIIFDRKLYFLKTTIKKGNDDYYFESIEHMFELVRRKTPRYIVPDNWSQSAMVESANTPIELKSPATILDISRTGMRLYIRADIPRYEKNQTAYIYFKIYRRAEILVKSRIVYVQRNTDGGGPIIGLEFSDNSILISNKIQNVCDDLAFFWTAKNNILHK